MAEVIAFSEISEKAITSKTQYDKVIYARFLFSFLAYQNDYTMTQIGNFINRDHSSVSYQVQQFKTVQEFINYGEKFEKWMKNKN